MPLTVQSFGDDSFSCDRAATDVEGRCSYTPKEGNLVLVVTHLMKPEKKGDGYDKTAYAATLVIDVPQRCPCCE